MKTSKENNRIAQAIYKILTRNITMYISGCILGISRTYKGYLRDTPGHSGHMDISGTFQAYLRNTPGISQDI
jgi:hypothetical protein